MPHGAGLGRLIACDLIGMGESEKLSNSGPDRYGYQEQREFLFGLWDKLDLRNDVIIVIHDWGSALGFDWARQNPKRVKGIVYMEAIVKRVTWQDWPENARKVFQGFRSERGEEMVLEKNIFVERVLPSSVLRGLTEEEMAVYRAPFATPGEDRRPTLSWPRQLPIDGEPASVAAIVDDYGRWLAESPIPKLFINAEPGSILTGAAAISAGPGQIKRRSRSREFTSSRRTVPTKSVAQLPILRDRFGTERSRGTDTLPGWVLLIAYVPEAKGPAGFAA
jgi:haloalkane dehalogenase